MFRELNGEATQRFEFGHQKSPRNCESLARTHQYTLVTSGKCVSPDTNAFGMSIAWKFANTKPFATSTIGGIFYGHGPKL